MARHPKIAVVVCTYNRADMLSGALETVYDQTLDPRSYEVIVIDNNSVDNTRAVVEDFGRRHFTMHYYLEPEQGLSNARNRGWKIARGEYVAYIDDDCKVPKQWLSIAKEIIDRFSPAAFGGPFYPFYDSRKPRWYKDSYGSHEPGRGAGVLKGGECVHIYGGNAFFRRDVLEKLGGFNAGLGMSGRKICYGEETALLRAIAATMPEEIIYYDPRLYVYHLVQATKMTMLWIVRSSFASGRACYRVFAPEAPLPGRGRLVREAFRSSRALAGVVARSLFRREHARYPHIQNYLYENGYRHVQKLGMLYEQFNVANNSHINYI